MIEVPLKGGIRCLIPVHRAVWLAREILTTAQGEKPKKETRTPPVVTYSHIVQMFRQNESLSYTEMIAAIGDILNCGQRQSGLSLSQAKKSGLVKTTGKQRSKNLKYHPGTNPAASIQVEKRVNTNLYEDLIDLLDLPF